MGFLLTPPSPLPILFVHVVIELPLVRSKNVITVTSKTEEAGGSRTNEGMMHFDLYLNGCAALLSYDEYICGVLA